MKFRKLKKINYLSLAALLMCQLSTVNATAASATMQVTASVAEHCEINANNLAFNPYDLTELTQNTTIEATCTNGTNYQIGIDGGLSADTASRAMYINGSTANASLSYSLSKPSGGNWGNTASDVFSAVGNGATQSHQVSGTVPANQTSPVNANYSDTLTVTIYFGSSLLATGQ